MFLNAQYSTDSEAENCRKSYETLLKLLSDEILIIIRNSVLAQTPSSLLKRRVLTSIIIVFLSSLLLLCHKGLVVFVLSSVHDYPCYAYILHLITVLVSV